MWLALRHGSVTIRGLVQKKNSMKLTSKLKTISIKCNPPRYTTRELEHGINAGLESPYHIRLSGQSPGDDAAARRRYVKNWQKGCGLCKGCKYHNAGSKTVGGHCKLKEQEHCAR